MLMLFIDGTKVIEVPLLPGRCTFLDPMEAVSTVAVGWIQAGQDTHERCRQLEYIPLPSQVLDASRDVDDMLLKDSRCLEGAYAILAIVRERSQQ
jgi:hypothetical protein